jgi:hypothetical protein
MSLDVINMVLPSPRRAVVAEALELVRGVRQWPSARVEVQGACTTIHSGVRDLRIARLDLGTGGLTVFIDADLAGQLVRSEPRVRATRDGVRLDIHDADSRAAGERVLRWRIDLERFGPQLRDASP